MADKKISQFIGQSLLQDADQFNFIRSSTNYRIPFSDLKLSLGTTGTIAAVGSSLATPVLSVPVAGINQIRGLESSKGIITALSASNGITVKTNFTQAVTGTTLIADLNAAQYKFKTLKPGADIALADDGDSVTISYSPGAASLRTVVISQLSDFPTPVAGVITFAANTDYFLQADISTSNRFVTGSSSTLRGPASQIVKLTYTGTGSMFTGVTTNFRIDRATVTCPNGALFDMSGGGILQMIESTVESCNTGGTIDGPFLARFKGMAWQDIKTDGITFTGAGSNAIFDTALTFLNGGTYIDLGAATFNTVVITNQIIEVSAAGTKFLDGAAASANINAAGVGLVTNNRIGGSATALTNISPNDSRWSFMQNNIIANTRPDVLLSFSTPTNTVITTINTPVLIAGTWVVERNSQMTGTAAGRATYDVERDAILPLTFTMSVEPVSGTNKIINAYFYKNGSKVAASKLSLVISSGSPKEMSLVWQDNFTTNDYYEVYVENGTGTTDITVNNAILRVN